MNDASLIDLNPIRSSGTDNLAYDDDDDEEVLIISPASNHTDSKLIDETVEADSASEVNFKGNCAHKKLVYAIDSVISAFIFAPLSALYWYGTWALFDVYLLPNYQLTSALISYVIGLIILLPGYIFQEKIQDLYNIKRNELVQFLIRFVYAYFVSLACVLEWRGIWIVLDIYILFDWKGQLSLAIVSIAYMLMTRSFRLVMTPPFSLQYDTYDDYFLSRSRYKFKLSQTSSYLQYCIDFMIVEIVESLATIIAWRNLSIVFDQFIAPGNIQRDILISLVIGYFLYFLLAYTQHLWCRVCSKLTLIPHLLIEDTFNFVMLMSIILLWRVYYIVPDLYFRVPHYQNEIYFLTHFLSFFASVLLNATVIMTGTGYEFKDGEISEDGDFFQLKYISSIMEIFETQL